MNPLTEPVRKSILDVVQNNLRLMGRATYITRIIYIGEYPNTVEDLQNKLEAVINYLRADYAGVLITGFLLIYPQYYIHILEAPEDILCKHFILICETDEKCGETTFSSAILLPSCFHVNRRVFTDWSHAYMLPPVLLEKLDKYTMSEIETQMMNFLTKIYKLCEYIANAVYDKTVTTQNILASLREKIHQYLPESTLVEYLLSTSSPVIKTIQDYLKIYMEVPFMSFYNERIWPPPCDFVPRQMFDNLEHHEVRHAPAEGRHHHHHHRHHHSSQ